MELTNVSTCVQGLPHFGHDRKFLSFGGSPELPDVDEPDDVALLLPLPPEPTEEPEPVPVLLPPAPAAAWESVMSILGLIAE